MKQTTEDKIRELFATLSRKNARVLVKDLYKQYNKDFDWLRIPITEEIKKSANRIFELCPDCNAIPVAYNYVSGSEYYTEYENYEELAESVNEYTDDAKDKGYIFPFADDEMKIKDYKELTKEVKNFHDLINGEDSQEYGDYCDFCHPTFYYFDRKSNSIKETLELS